MVAVHRRLELSMTSEHKRQYAGFVPDETHAPISYMSRATFLIPQTQADNLKAPYGTHEKENYKKTTSTPKRKGSCIWLTRQYIPHMHPPVRVAVQKTVERPREHTHGCGKHSNIITH